MNRLVTGASGFLGRHLISHLKLHFPNDRLVALCRNSKYEKQTDDITWIDCDLGNSDDVKQIIGEQKADEIYHLAGAAKVSNEMNFEEYFEKNVIYTKNIVDALIADTKPKALFFSSSVHIYGMHEEIVLENAIQNPFNHYGYTKYLAEQYIRDQIRDHDHLKVIIGRLFTCIGPGQSPGFVVSDLCRKIATLSTATKGNSKKASVLKVRNLESYRQFMDVRDVVKLFPQLMSLKSDKKCDAFHIASPDQTKIETILKLLLEISRISPKIEHETSEKTLKALNVGTEKLNKAIKNQSFTPLKETLSDTYQWVYEQEIGKAGGLK